MFRPFSKRPRQGSRHAVPRDEVSLDHYDAPSTSLCAGASFSESFRWLRVVADQSSAKESSLAPSAAGGLCWSEGLTPLGPSPSGTLRIRIRPDLSCPGFGPESSCIELTYNVPAGIQRAFHPTPGAPYSGTWMPRVAYLPHTRDGRLLLWRLRYAFSRGLTFLIGRSDTTGEDGTVVWTRSFPHKTSLRKGEHGYPDPHYLSHCHACLDDLGHVPRAPQEEEDWWRNASAAKEFVVVYEAPMEWTPPPPASSERSSAAAAPTSAQDAVVPNAECSVCFEMLSLRPSVQLSACYHAFHLNCATTSLGHSPRCPVCRELVGAPRGRSPSGTMAIQRHPPSGNTKGCQWLEITYTIPSGIQREYHDNPGAPFAGTRRTAYLPHTDEGCRLLTRLRYSWNHGLTFTVGRSLTTGISNVVTWTSIPHKTSLDPNDPHGHPDAKYCADCNRALDAMGVPDADACLALLPGDRAPIAPGDALDRQLKRTAFVTCTRHVNAVDVKGPKPVPAQRAGSDVTGSTSTPGDDPKPLPTQRAVSDTTGSSSAAGNAASVDWVLIDDVEAVSLEGMNGCNISSSLPDGYITETTVDTTSTEDSVEIAPGSTIAPQASTWDDAIAFLISEPLVIRDSNNDIQPVRKLAFGRERKLVWRCLEKAKRKIDLYFEAATQKALIEAQSRGCRCLHYSGHGHPERLFFESLGMAVSLSIPMLQGLVLNSAGRTFQLVFISACHSFPIGQAMASAGVQHVVCCDENSELKDEAALRFTEGFYYALATGKSVKMAFEQGRKSVWDPDIPDSECEQNKFFLLGDGDHNLPIFDDAASVSEWPVNGTIASILAAQNKIQEVPPPSPPPNFMGRDVDMYWVLRRVLAGQGKGLVTLLGESGVGCSSLARALCQRINERSSTMPFRRIYFVDAVDHSSDKCLRRLTGQLYTAKKLPHQPPIEASIADMADATCEALRESDALVVFDGIVLNPEDDCDQQFRRFLKNLSSEATVLVTSRRALDVVNEQTYDLQPLTFGYTVRLFVSSLPAEFSWRERRYLFETIVVDETLENLRITDSGIDPATNVTFRALGSGVPGWIEHAAQGTHKGDLDRLLSGSYSV